jgi:hypothetical protein
MGKEQTKQFQNIVGIWITDNYVILIPSLSWVIWQTQCRQIFSSKLHILISNDQNTKLCNKKLGIQILPTLVTNSGMTHNILRPLKIYILLRNSYGMRFTVWWISASFPCYFIIVLKTFNKTANCLLIFLRVIEISFSRFLFLLP